MNPFHSFFMIAFACLIVAPSATALGTNAGTGPGARPGGGQESVRRLPRDRAGRSAKATDVSSFEAIANRPGRTIDTIVDAMYAPHPAMPGIPLTTQEMRDVAAYILTFRKKGH